MSTGGIEGLELDRTKAIREMHRKYRYEQDDDHRYRRERNKRAEEDEESSDDFNNDCRPAKQVGCRNPDGVQHINDLMSLQAFASKIAASTFLDRKIIQETRFRA
jgi:hypothetical protein